MECSARSDTGTAVQRLAQFQAAGARLPDATLERGRALGGRAPGPRAQLSVLALAARLAPAELRQLAAAARALLRADCPQLDCDVIGGTYIHVT